MIEGLHPAVIHYLYISEPEVIVSDYLAVEKSTEPYDPVSMKIVKLKGLQEEIISQLTRIKEEMDKKKDK